MLSEPVFLIPLLAWMVGINIESLLILIAVFQIMSIFSIQLGKYMPPEYQSGAVIAFILCCMNNIPLPLAIAAGLMSAYMFNALFRMKLTINQKLINTLKNRYLAITTSIITSITMYFIIYVSVWMLGHLQYNFHSSYNVIPIILALALLKAGNTKTRPSGMILFSLSLITVITAAICLI